MRGDKQLARNHSLFRSTDFTANSNLCSYHRSHFGFAISGSITSTAIPTSTFDNQPTPETATRTAPPLWLTLALFGVCCAMLLPVGVLVIGFIARNQNRNREDNGQ